MRNFQKIEDKREWQELLNKTLFRTFFHNLEWEEFLEKNFKWLKFERYLYKRDLLLSFARYRIFGSEHIVSHPFCEYGGPLVLVKEVDFQQFKEDLFKEFKNPLKISFHPYLLNYFKNAPLKSFKAFGDLERVTYFIEDFNQKNKETLWRCLRKTTRHQIKKAKEQSLIIKRCENQKELKDFYNLYLKITKKHQIPAYPFSFLKFFLDSPNSEIILAKFKNKIIAGSLFLFYNGILHYFLNASESKLICGVNHLILWMQIEKYVGKNFQVFDLGGTKAGSSLQIFKEGFRARALPILEIKNFKEKKTKFGLLRKIWGLLPLKVIKILSPHLLKYKL